jgi:hypothetical protein
LSAAAAVSGRKWVGPDNPRWRGGKQITAKGYVRLTAGPDRHAYEHRVVIRDLLREWNFWGLDEIPAGFTVHHIDFRESHNSPSNLLLLDEAIHNAFADDYRLRFADGRFTPEPEMPEWVYSDRGARG